MIGPMPKFMATKEWKEYRTIDPNDLYFEPRLKQGAPEWLQKEFKKYRDHFLLGYLENGYLTKEEYEAAINKSIRK
jgi:hypothetical protein